MRDMTHFTSHVLHLGEKILLQCVLIRSVFSASKAGLVHVRPLVQVDKVLDEAMSRVSIFGILALASSLLMACTSGLEINQQASSQIMSKRNTSTTTVVPDLSRYMPYPLPILPAASAPSINTVPSRSGPRTAPNTSGDTSPAADDLGKVYFPGTDSEPFNSFAKLAFSLGLEEYLCSAEFVGDSNDVVMTAAHCVYDSKKQLWYDQFYVYPKYNGVPVKMLDWECVAIYRQWSNRDWRFDYAFIKLKGKGPAALQLRAAQMPLTWTSAGYPVNYGNNVLLAAVDGSYGDSDGGLVKMSDNPMGGGSSGGAWISGRMAIGLNSFQYENDTNSMWGPLFDASTIALHQYVRQSCP